MTKPPEWDENLSSIENDEAYCRYFYDLHKLRGKDDYKDLYFYDRNLTPDENEIASDYFYASRQEKIEIEEMYNLHKPGAKDDAAKRPVGLVFESFPRALLAVAKVAGDGAKKYTRGGWQTVPDGIERYSDAEGRHLLKRFIDGDADLESGSLHLAHSAWNSLAILELTLREKENDNHSG